MPQQQQQHTLTDVVRFTQRRTGWQDHPSGGSTPIYSPLEHPYYLWYCTCGAVGGKAGTEQAAKAGFLRHVERWG
jgi:hypothetical protein